jgi:hypothetical protein
MVEKERRNCRRYAMNFPVIISSTRALGNPEGCHYGEILDAGKHGVRMRVNQFGSLAVGTELMLICQSAAQHQQSSTCMPVPIKGRVVWEDADTREFALVYVQ